MSKLATRVLIILIIVCMPYLALALPGVHNPTVGGITCASCHSAGTTTGSAAFNSNVCTKCHFPGGITPSASGNIQMVNTFVSGDSSNPFKTYTGAITGRPYQSSHKFIGGDTVPQANALPPTDPYNTTTNSIDVSKGMNKTSLLGTLSCVRCHNVHGNSALTSVNPPFLRSINDQDQMCRDCHRGRDVPSATYGSHAVNVSYTSAKVKAGVTAGTYLSSPLTNSTNNTAQVKLVKGLLQCSSCHGVHYSDSNSRTFDSSTSAKLGNLSTSKGYLLRISSRGKTANDSNICTNCHNGKMAHNGSSQNVQCNDCHSGHVEYDGNAVSADEKLPNQSLIRRYMNFSSAFGAVRNVRVFFRASSATIRDKYTLGTSGNPKTLPNQGYGVCQACHFETSKYTAEHEIAGVLKTDHANCKSCHAHSDPSSSGGGNSFTGGCNTCHGYPPEHTVAGTVSKGGYAVYSSTNNVSLISRSYLLTSGVYKNESTAGHPTHAANKPYNFACTECHNGNNHKKQSYQDVFLSPAGTLSSSATFVGGVATSTCANMYCHSYGTATLKNPKTVSWAAGIRKSIVGTASECVACHNGVITGFNTMSTNSHFRHVSNVGTTGKNIGCVVCHSATVSNNTTISSTTSHVNGIRDVAYNGTTVGLTLTGSTWSGTTCATYCHTDGKGSPPVVIPTWIDRTSGKCGTCHAAMSPMIATNAHFTHLSTATANAWGPDLAGIDTVLCAKCHTTYTGELGANHVNGTVDAPLANCTTTCHRNGTPTWSNPARLACETCHDNLVSYDPRYNNISAPRKNYTFFKSNGHGQYNSYYCTQCHDNTTKHISGKRNDTNRLINGWDSAENNLCFSCHNGVTPIVTNTARQNLPTHDLDKLATPPPSLCTSCHDTHGTNNYASILGSISFKTTSSAVTITKPTTALGFINTSTKRGLCQVCHTATNHFRRDKTEPVNGFSGSGTDHSTFDATTNCLACHKHTGAYAFYPSGGACNGCHGYPPVPKSTIISATNYPNAKFEDYSGAGGSHTAFGHVPSKADPAKQFALCNSCHNALDHNMGGDYTKADQIKVRIDSRLRFNPTILPSYTSNRLSGASHLPGNCSNVSCHFQKTVTKWGNKP